MRLGRPGFIWHHDRYRIFAAWWNKGTSGCMSNPQSVWMLEKSRYSEICSTYVWYLRQMTIWIRQLFFGGGEMWVLCFPIWIYFVKPLFRFVLKIHADYYSPLGTSIMMIAICLWPRRFVWHIWLVGQVLHQYVLRCRRFQYRSRRSAD